MMSIDGVKDSHGEGARGGSPVPLHCTAPLPATPAARINLLPRRPSVATTPSRLPHQKHASTPSVRVPPVIGPITHPIPVRVRDRAENGDISPSPNPRRLGSAGAWAALFLALLAASSVVGPPRPAALGAPASLLPRHAMTRNERTLTQPRPTGVEITGVLARAPCHTHENGATDSIVVDNVVLSNGA